MSTSTTSRLQYYAHGAATLALLPTVVGLLATLRPAFGLSMLSFPQPSTTSTPQDQATIIGLTRLFGGRDLVIGGSSLIVWYFGGARRGTKEGCTALAGMMFLGVFLVGVDGVASIDAIGKGEWTHWSFAPIGFTLGMGLLGWI